MSVVQAPKLRDPRGTNFPLTFWHENGFEVMLRRNFLTIPVGAALTPQLLLDEVMPLTLANMERVGDEMLPAVNKEPPEHKAQPSLLKDLTFYQVHTVGDLRRLITSQLGKVLENDRQIVQCRRDLRKGILREDERQRNMRGVFFTHVGLIRTCLSKRVSRPLPISS
jgi:hypothetical protein